jgi:uncharacterized protein
MNKPAPKEPSMDEILSSIRQIIADDDASGAPRRPAIQAAPPPMQAAPVRSINDSLDRDLSDMLDDIEPLALSPSQIVAPTDEGGFSFDSLLAESQSEEGGEAEPVVPHLVEADDIGFAVEDDEEEEDDDLPSFDPPPMRTMQPEPPRLQAVPAAPVPEPVIELPPRAPEPVVAPVAQAPQPPRPQPTIAQAAPMPDPTLSSDIADQLLEPATRAAVRGSITKLNNMGIGTPGATIEGLMRDMLRPMLKEWLDENLPAVVERMVEKEIARISRGD